MRVRTWLCAGLGLALAFGRPAHARFSPYMASLEVGGGVMDFARHGYRERTSPAGAWDARLNIGTRTPIGFEIAYLGTAQKLHDPLGPDPTLATNSVEGQVRFNLSTWRVQPYVAGGVGYINFHSYGRNQAPVVEREFQHNVNSVAFPVTGGLAAYLGKHGLVDARFTYRFVKDAGDGDISPDLHQRPDNWAATLGGGYAF